MGQKNVAIAYILWFFFGLFGVHQFYLRRDRHAFFLWSTLGGVSGLGFLRDLFYIPTYVADANDSEENRIQRMTRSGKPSQGFCRWAASVVLGFLFSLLAFSAFWKEDLHPRHFNALVFLAHTFAAIGVHIPCNEGNLKVKLKWCLLGSYIVLPYTIWYGADSLWNGALISSAVAGYKTEWKMERPSRSLCTRVMCLSLLGIIYLGLLSTSVYYNATVTTKGETVPLREAVHNFFNSKAWKETRETMSQIYNYYKHHGWKAIWEELVSALDPQGEAHAYEVLGLTSSATQKDIKKAYKHMALKYHPDKEKDPSKKDEVSEKFMKIQKAYDTLSKLKQSRSQKSEL